MARYTYLTKEGFVKLKADLEELKTTERHKIAMEIAEAREKGDLSENAEYKAAKEAQGMLEMRINELELSLANVRIIDESQLDTSRVVVLSNVRIKNLKNGKELKYKLVSESEADLKLKKISMSSPIGQGLMGKKVGEIVAIETPAGTMEFEIMEISLG